MPNLDKSSDKLSRRSRIDRRTALASITSGLAATAFAQHAVAQDPAPSNLLSVDPAPQHSLSPYLYMQFMEPLGATDGSVEAAWDHLNQRWRPDVVETTSRLAPGLMRWGGIFTDFYRWKEGVGPRDKRPSMLNLLWGGIESNQVGTAEFLDFCRQVNSDPLICVNFESDGRERYMRAAGKVRTGDAAEAAEWVAYCNQQRHELRASHGSEDPMQVGLWQLGNETSYDRNGFDLETSGKKTVEFAQAMRAVDPSIQLIGWGDSGWAPRMHEIAGEHLQYLAFHHMFDPDDHKNPVLRNLEYRKDPDRTWHQLMQAVHLHDRKIKSVRDTLPNNDIPLAMTECHFAIPGRDRCDVMSTWATGVAYARMLNLHQRHGDALKIATAADFCGNRWQVNAVMIPTPIGRGDAFLMPVAEVMRLYRKHSGEQFVKTITTPDGLDVAASRTGNKVFLHVVNTQRQKAVPLNMKIDGMKINKATAHTIAVQPEFEMTRFTHKALYPVASDAPASGAWEAPAASVTALELDCQPVTG